MLTQYIIRQNKNTIELEKREYLFLFNLFNIKEKFLFEKYSDVVKVKFSKSDCCGKIVISCFFSCNLEFFDELLTKIEETKKMKNKEKQKKELKKLFQKVEKKFFKKNENKKRKN